MLHQSIFARIAPLLLLLLVALSCEREDITPVVGTNNTAPIAKAGSDTMVYLPDSREFELDGSSSFDPDGRRNALAYLWSQLSGPHIANFTGNGIKSKFLISDTGTYQFALTVTDAEQNIARDTVMVTARWGSSCNPSAAIVEIDSILRFKLDENVPSDISFARGGKYLAFAGGRTEWDDGWGGSDRYSNSVYIYDMVSQTVYKNKLSFDRGGIGIAVTNSEVFFAGGQFGNGASNVVDIFDLSTKSMSLAQLSLPRSFVSAVVAGNKLFFAGGRDKFSMPSDVVDIFDQDTRTWSTSRLSQARAGISAVSSGSKVFFAGGDTEYGTPSSRIDVYDLNTGQWSTLELPTPRFNISSSLMGGKILFAGGYKDKIFAKVNQVDMLDQSSLTFKSECIVAGEFNYMAYGPDMISTVVNGKDYYYLNNYIISRYQSDSQKWSFSVISSQENWLGLFSEGDRLFGITMDPDFNSSGYVGTLIIYEIGF